MIIDKSKNYATFKTEHQQKEKVKKIYSDQNVVTIKTATHTNKDKQTKIITNKGYKEYKDTIQQKKNNRNNT